MAAFNITLGSLAEFPKEGTAVLYIHYENGKKPGRLKSGLVTNQAMGVIQEHGTGKLHKPYLSEVIPEGAVINEVAATIKVLGT